MISVVFVLILFLCSASCDKEEIYIEATNGAKCPSTASSCLSVTDFGRKSNRFDSSTDLVVNFLAGTHLLQLTELVIFRNLHNATFKGLGNMEQGFHETIWQSSVVIRCAGSYGGLGFVNCSNTVIKFITMANCGARYDKSVYSIPLGWHTELYTIRPCYLLVKHHNTASLGFYGGGDVLIDHVSIQNGTGFGLLVITTGSNVNITFSSFGQNFGCIPSTANVFLYHTKQATGDTSSSAPYTTTIADSNMTFGDTGQDFLKLGVLVYLEWQYSASVHFNKVLVTGQPSDVTTYNNMGVTLFITSNVYQYSVLFNSITIRDTNSFSGAGLTVHSLQSDGMKIQNGSSDESPLLNITILNSLFTNNHAYISGGGVYINLPALNWNVLVTVEETILSNNSAIVGAGLAFNVNTTVSYDVLITISSTNITHNSGCVGVGLFLTHTEQNKISSNMTLRNVVISRNIKSSNCTSIHDHSHSVVLAIESQTNLLIQGVDISHNYKSCGLLAYNTLVVISDNSMNVFSNNTLGENGGGMALYGESYITLESDAQLLFSGNTVTGRGGAIFVKDSRLDTDKPCFFTVKPNSSSSMVFYGNKAEIAGSVLFGGQRDEECSKTFQHSKVFNYSRQTGPLVIASDPVDLCFCSNEELDCSRKTLIIHGYLGQALTIPLATTDKLDNIVPGTVYFYHLYDPEGLFAINYDTVSGRCTNVPIQATHRVYSLTVFTQERFRILDILGKELFIIIKPCPVGFKLSNITKICGCQKLMSKLNRIDLNCDIATNTFSHEGNYWIGEDNGTVVYGDCPVGHCVTEEVNVTLTDPEPQCASNRTGTLCGQCQEGLSLVFGSNSCKKCSNLYLLLLIPFAVAGFALVALLMLLNLTVSAGTINGLIFYANIIRLFKDVLFTYSNIPILTQFISWINLDLGIETCFYEGMTAYGKVGLQFVFPLYIWLIILTIIVLCRYSTWLSAMIGSNVVPVLATLILLSYTKLIRTLVLTMKRNTLHGVNQLVWYADGSVEYYSWSHLLLTIFAFSFTTLYVPYLVALIFEKYIERYLTRVGLIRKWWYKFKPLLDAYNGPYKDRCRFWTGLLLLIRLVLVTIEAVFDISDMLIILIVSITVTLLTLMVILGGIYRKKLLDLLECWYLLNLVFLCFLALNNHQYVGLIISASLQLVTVVCVSLYHLRHLKIIQYCKKFYLFKTELFQELKSDVADDSHYNSQSDEVTFFTISSNNDQMQMKRESLLESRK